MKTPKAKAPNPWAALRKRIGRPDTRDIMIEWFMPLDDKLGKRAWRVWAEPLGARYVDGKEPGVAWDFPLVSRMQRALANAEAEYERDMNNVLLYRVVRDLRSYRDTGCSTFSPDKPKRSERAAVGLARKAAKRAR